MKSSKLSALLLFVLLSLSFTHLICSCKPNGPINKEPATSSGAGSTAVGATTVDKTGSITKEEKPINKKVLIISTKDITSDLSNSAVKFLQSNYATIENIKLTFTETADPSTDDNNYDKVIYITTAITERIELFFSDVSKANMQANKNKYIGIAVQRIGKGAKAPDIAKPFNLAILTVEGHSANPPTQFKSAEESNQFTDFIKL